jgi:hypothetical protein
MPTHSCPLVVGAGSNCDPTQVETSIINQLLWGMENLGELLIIAATY